MYIAAQKYVEIYHFYKKKKVHFYAYRKIYFYALNCPKIKKLNDNFCDTKPLEVILLW